MEMEEFLEDGRWIVTDKSYLIAFFAETIVGDYARFPGFFSSWRGQEGMEVQ